MPVAAPWTSTDIAREADRLEGRPPAEILTWAAAQFGDRHRLRHRLRRRGLRARGHHRPPSAAHPHHHARHRRVVPRDLRAVAHAGSEVRRDHPRRAPRAHPRRAGRPVRRPAVGERARSVLRPPQGRAAAGGAARPRRVDHVHPPRPDERPRDEPRGRARRDVRPGQGESARDLERPGREGLPEGARRSQQPAARAGLPEHRLLALHEPRGARRGPAVRPLARTSQDRMRAACAAGRHRLSH